MLVEMMRPAEPAWGLDLTRRWLAALLRVEPEDRERIVSSVEGRIAQIYPGRAYDAITHTTYTDLEFDVVHPPRSMDGYTEQTITTYAVEKPKPSAAQKKSPPPGARGQRQPSKARPRDRAG